MPAASRQQVLLHQGEVATVVEGVPSGNGFAGKAPVRERDDQRCFGPEHPGQLAQNRHRLGQVVDGNADGRAVKFGVGEGQQGLLVQILHQVGVQARVGAQLGGVQPQAHYAALGHFERQMAHPAAHQIEHGPVGREILPVELGDGGNGRVIDVGDEARVAVEVRVGRFVLALEGAGGKGRVGGGGVHGGVSVNGRQGLRVREVGFGSGRKTGRRGH